MATIKLKNVRSGEWREYPLAYFDFDAWIAAGGQAGSDTVVVGNTGLTPEQLGGNTTFYYVSVGDAYRYLIDAIEPTDERNLLYVESGTLWRDIFTPTLISSPTTYTVPPSGYNGLGTYWYNDEARIIGSTHQVAAAPESFDPTLTYYSSDKATAAFDTYNGGHFGISMVVKQAFLTFMLQKAEAHITVGAKQWGMLATSANTERQNIAWSPSMVGGLILTDGAGDYRSTDAGYEIPNLADYETAKCPTEIISTQCIYAKHNGVPLCGAASILWGYDDFGNLRPVSFKINLIPLWFWGQIQGEFNPDVPDIDDIPVSEPDIGLGSYQITESPAGIASPPAISPLANVDTTQGGIHVFVCDAAAIAEIERQLWKQSFDNSERGIASALSGIIACGFMPADLIGPNYKDPQYKRDKIELGGYPIELTSGNAWLINHRIFTTTYIGGAIDSHFCVFSGGDGEPLGEVYHSYHDYEPFTSVRLIIPFCGEISIPASSCIGGRITVDFACNLTTGDVCATVQATSSPRARSGLLTTGALTTTRYLFGNAFSRFPITGSSNGMSQYIAGAANLVTGIAAIGAGGVAGAVAGGSQIISGLAGLRNSDKQPVSGASPVGSPSIIGNKQVILEVTRPTPYADGYYKAMVPPAAEVIAEIGTLKLPATDSATVGGLTPVQVKEVFFEDTDDITAAELDQIDALLKGGVLL